MAGPQVLSRRAVNRALLARQLLLERRELPEAGPERAAHVTGLKAVLEQLRPSLVTFRDESGAELFDLPGAPRPGPETPAPPRLVADFDNLVLAHAERSRVISPAAAQRISTVNGVIPGTVLIDGFVAGMWRLDRGREEATVTVELFEPQNPKNLDNERDGLTAEATRVLAFGAPGVTHRVRFAPPKS